MLTILDILIKTISTYIVSAGCYYLRNRNCH